MSNLKCQGTSISATLISALQWQLAMSKAFPKKLCRKGKETEMADYLFTGQVISGGEAFCLQLELYRKNAPKLMVRKGLYLVDTTC